MVTSYSEQTIQIIQNNWHTYNDYLKLQEATSVISELISRCKDEYQNYIASKLNDLKTNAKTYWSMSKTFYYGKKLPIISPLLINNKLISDSKVKANYFNGFFAFQCTPLHKNSKTLETHSYVTNTKLPSVKF